MGFALAFVALPLYVILPNHYARTFGVPLATLGLVLLTARLFDAVIDPLLGRWGDGLFGRAQRQVLQWAGLAAVALVGGFTLLMFPPALAPDALVLWALVFLVVTYTGYSAVSILHQSWGARLGGGDLAQSRIVAWREGLGLIGVVFASISPVTLGLPATAALFFVASVLGLWAWSAAPQPAAPAKNNANPQVSLWHPLQQPQFRALLGVFMVNGIASAIPATLILFFVQDRLQAPATMEPAFLGAYFVCAAMAIPLWLKLVDRMGLARTWACGMVLSVAVFVFASQLGAGDTAAFLLVCALSGVALGTDLALPGALLAVIIQKLGDGGQAEGAYFGWWNFATKLNLALAAGISLPALAWLGYVPGARDAAALDTLTWAYCLLPCGLKLAATALLYFFFLRKTP
jgi:Na+/melibiose symporter-like transporter